MLSNLLKDGEHLSSPSFSLLHDKQHGPRSTTTACMKYKRGTMGAISFPPKNQMVSHSLMEPQAKKHQIQKNQNKKKDEYQNINISIKFSSFFPTMQKHSLENRVTF